MSLASLIREYPEETKKVAGKDEKLSKLSREDAFIFATELETVVHAQQNPIVRDIIIRNAPLILDLVRIVNVETKQGFKGMAARGSELEMSWIVPRTFNKTTWLQSITATGTINWLAETKALEEEGLIILGWIDPIEDPKINRILYTKDGDPITAQTLTFEVRKGLGITDLPVSEQKQPLIVPPEHKIKIDMHAFATGDDRIQPIGFHIRKASDFMSLPGPIFGTA